MKIESFAMSDNEVLRALRMFVDEKWDDGKFHLISIESIAEDGESLVNFITRTDNSEIPSDVLSQMVEFPSKFDLREWMVFVLYTSGDVMGLIAFSEWS